VNKCPNRRPINLADYEGDEHMIDDDGLQEVAYAEEEGIVFHV